MTPWKTRGVGIGLLAGACARSGGVAMLNAAPAWADDSNRLHRADHGPCFPAPAGRHVHAGSDRHIRRPLAAYFRGSRCTTSSATPSACTRPKPITARGSPKASLTWTARSASNSTAGNDDLVVFGYSMSNSIATQEMINLAGCGRPRHGRSEIRVGRGSATIPTADIFTRFPGIFGVNLPATPADTSLHHRRSTPSNTAGRPTSRSTTATC